MVIYKQDQLSNYNSLKGQHGKQGGNAWDMKGDAPTLLTILYNHTRT